MNYSFDTSAVNDLYHDPDRDSLSDGLLATNSVRITALNVIEASAIQEEAGRWALLRFLKRLTENRRPLGIPTDLLVESVRAHSRRDRDMTITIDSDQDGIWLALNEPSQMEEWAREESSRWKFDREHSFKQMHELVRVEFQKVFKNETALRPRTASDLLRHFSSNEDFLYDMVGPTYSKSSAIDLGKSSVRTFLVEVPLWRHFLLAQAYAIFRRGIAESGYSAKRQPGSLDLSCAVYLGLCDFFVTGDRPQHVALRLINAFNAGPASRYQVSRVLSYREFRRRLLVL